MQELEQHRTPEGASALNGLVGTQRTVRPLMPLASDYLIEGIRERRSTCSNIFQPSSLSSWQASMDSMAAVATSAALP